MLNIEIKPATIEDIPIILDFIKKLAEYEKLSHQVSATEQNLKNSLFSANPDAEVVLAYLNNKPVAIAIFFHNYSTFLAKKGLYLEDLFVLKDYRNQGIGKKVLQYLAKLAIERDCGRFEWSVLDWNSSAISFYKNIGAEIKSEWLTTQLTGEALKSFAESN
jgi:GNAT superfamily N-acetyltransferase